MNKTNKIILLTLFAITLFIVLNPVAMAEGINYENLCANTEDGIGKAVKIIGTLVQVIKWIIPLLIIVLGMVDFGQAVLSNDEKAINKAASSLLRRFIAGVAVFFIPTLVLAFLNLIHITGDIENSTRFGACTTCILDVSKCK